MIQDYSAHQADGAVTPTGVYYTPGRGSASRRQQKRELLLTFIDHVNAPKPKQIRRSAPVKPTLLKTLFSFLA
jgi:hypothetical protein